LDVHAFDMGYSWCYTCFRHGLYIVQNMLLKWAVPGATHALDMGYTWVLHVGYTWCYTCIRHESGCRE